MGEYVDVIDRRNGNCGLELARRFGLGVTVAEDGVRAVNVVECDGARALQQMREAGADIRPAADILSMTS